MQIKGGTRSRAARISVFLHACIMELVLLHLDNITDIDQCKAAFLDAIGDVLQYIQCPRWACKFGYFVVPGLIWIAL